MAGRPTTPTAPRRVMSLVRQMRGGQDYDTQWGKRMTGEGPIADLISRRFDVAQRRFGLDRALPPLDVSLFKVPGGGVRPGRPFRLRGQQVGNRSARVGAKSVRGRPQVQKSKRG